MAITSGPRARSKQKQGNKSVRSRSGVKLPPLGPVGSFIEHHYCHFNAAVLLDAARAYRDFLACDGKMMISMGGAMSTAELGLSLAEMIRRDKVHLITCTGANLEEDVFNLIAYDSYEDVPNYRHLTPREEKALLDCRLNRVTDTCIPEYEIMERMEKPILKLWEKADRKGERYFPHEFLQQLLAGGEMEKYYQIDPKNSWMLAAMEKKVPIVVPGWEDSTLGNMYASYVIRGNIKNPHTVRTGVEYMVWLADFYTKMTKRHPMGMFQIGGGITGDFPICVVPMLQLDLERDVPLWGYFCQVSDSTTSYGSYSGAVPNEKITWGKIGVDTPSFIIESDATIVAPLVFAYVLGW
jgi:deoxyhypusine synthase